MVLCDSDPTPHLSSAYGVNPSQFTEAAGSGAHLASLPCPSFPRGDNKSCTITAQGKPKVTPEWMGGWKRPGLLLPLTQHPARSEQLVPDGSATPCPAICPATCGRWQLWPNSLICHRVTAPD